MDYALSTQGQGSTSFIAIPGWGFNARADTSGISFIEVDLMFHDWRGASFAYVLGSSGSTQNTLRVVTADGSVVYRTGATNRITSGPGLIVLGARNRFRLEYEKASTTTSLYVNDILIGSYVAANTLTFNQIGRFFTTAGTYSDLTLFSFSAGGALYASYSDTWDGTTATGTGDSWLSTSGSRSLSITNATGASDSWWIPQGATLAPVTSFAIIEAGLRTDVSKASALATVFRVNVSRSASTTAAFRTNVSKTSALASVFRQNLERISSTWTALRGNVSRLSALTVDFGSLGSISSLRSLATAFRTNVSKTSPTTATLRGNVSKTSALASVFRQNLAKTSALATVFRVNVSRSASLDLALLESLETLSSVQVQLLGLSTAYNVLSLTLEGVTDWNAPAYRVALSLDVPRAPLTFGNKAGISLQTPRAKI